MDLANFLIQTLNSVQYGLLLFLLAAGLTLIFGIMGVRWYRLVITKKIDSLISINPWVTLNLTPIGPTDRAIAPTN